MATGATEDPEGSQPKDPKISPEICQHIPQKDPRNHPRTHVHPPRGICLHPPEHFPSRPLTSAAGGTVGPGFPPGSGRSPPCGSAGIPHPLWGQAPGWRQHPAPWGQQGRGSTQHTCWGAGSLAGLQKDPQGWGAAPAAPTHLRLLQIRSRSCPGLSAGISHSQAARKPQTLLTSQPRNLEGTHGDILGIRAPQPASQREEQPSSSPFFPPRLHINPGPPVPNPTTAAQPKPSEPPLPASQHQSTSSVWVKHGGKSVCVGHRAPRRSPRVHLRQAAGVAQPQGRQPLGVESILAEKNGNKPLQEQPQRPGTPD